MKWEEYEKKYWIGTVPAGESIDEGLSEFCDLISNYVLPDNREVNWDYLHVGIWTDSGRIIVFPASTSTVYRIEKSACQVIFEDMLMQYEELADSDIPDDEFETLLQEVLGKWVNLFLSAARTSSLTGVRVVLFNADSQTPIHDGTL